MERAGSAEILPKKNEFSKKMKNAVKIIKGDPLRDYFIVEKIGEGATGSVFKAEKINVGGQVALKKIELVKGFDRTRVVNEIGLMQMTLHKNIINCISAYESKRYYPHSEICLVLELMQGSLFSLVSKGICFTEPVIAYVCQEILQGLSWLHSFSRIHRDIKTENILYDAKGHIKLSDFGVSAQLTLGNELRSTVIGTPSYMAPEIIEGKGYDKKVDIWGLGVVAYELAERELPISGRNKMEILAMISNSPAPRLKNQDIWTQDFRDFIEKCFEKQSKERSSAQELLRHKFLKIADHEEFLKLFSASR